MDFLLPNGSFGPVQLALSAYLAGLIWTVQCGVYPSFVLMNPDHFQRFHSRYTVHITWIVGPVMLLETALCAIWAAEAWVGSYIPSWIGFSQLALSLVALASTFFVQVPKHRDLSRGWSLEVATSLVRSNWIRTAAWTLKLLLSLWAQQY